MLLCLHVGDLSSCHVPRYSYGAASVSDFTIATAVLKRIKMFANLPVVAIWIDRLVFVKARGGSYVLLLLHRMLRMQLRVLWMIFMAIDNDRRRSAVLMIVTHVDI